MSPTAATARAASLSFAVRSQARIRTGKTALTAGAEELSYQDLHTLTQLLAGHLLRLGVRPLDRVVILGLNSVEWVVAFLGCLDIGAIAVPLNQRLSQAELAQQIDRVEPRLVLADEALIGDVALPGEAAGAKVRALSLGPGNPGSVWQEPRERVHHDVPPGEAPALIAFTSGSTGTAKGAVITHAALAQAARACALAVGTDEDDRTLIMAPLFHNTGFCDQLAHMLMGGGTVDLLPKFGVGESQLALGRRPASYLITVPGILRLLMDGEDADTIFGACRIACFGGSPMPVAWIWEMAERWPALRLFNIYGLTEFTSLSHCLAGEDLARHADSVGLPVADVEQLVVDDEGTPVPPGELGTILLAGPSRMRGYWRAPESTAQALRGRWLVTGDVGSLSADGFLRLVGRASDVINRGGEKVSPIQVEQAVNLAPSIGESGVVGAPHPVFGERVVAFVTLNGTSDLDEDETRRHLRRHVAEYAVPERFFVVDELPRNAAGKIDRLELRRYAETAWAEPDVA